jgi:hypothetical protein
MPGIGKRVRTDPASVLQRPALAAMAFAVENHMSGVDAMIASLVGTLAPGAATAVIDYFLDLRNDAPKAAMIQALARSQLIPDYLILFSKVWKLYETAQKLRNPIAHWVWGICDELPDALVCVNPHDLLKVDAKRDAMGEIIASAHMDAPTLREDAAGVADAILFAEYEKEAQVYREKDFEDIIRDLQTLYDIVREFHEMVRLFFDRPEEGYQKYLQLIQKPAFRNQA